MLDSSDLAKKTLDLCIDRAACTSELKEDLEVRKPVYDHALKIVKMISLFDINYLGRLNITLWSNEVIVLSLMGNHQDGLELWINENDCIRGYVFFSDDDSAAVYCTTAEFPFIFDRFIKGTFKPWKEYRLKPFKAIQWNGDNLDEVRSMVCVDRKKSACWIEAPNALCVEVDIYDRETSLPTGVYSTTRVYPGDYLVFREDRVKSIPARYFNEFFEEDV